MFFRRLSLLTLLTFAFSGAMGTGMQRAAADDDAWFSALKGVEVTEDLTYSAGGALRYRYIDERNRLRPPLAGRKTSYQQWRFNPYVELKYQDDVTLYVEAIDASTFGQELPLTGIDTNRTDLQQYYIDLNLYEFEDDGAIHLRYGRQTLKYGSQHLISPLAWANTFRNFEGTRLYYTSKEWDIDAFAVQPVHDPAGLKLRPTSFDSPDQSRWFSGVYSTYKGLEGRSVDIYWLWLREKEDRIDRVDGNRHTLGMRYAGKQALETGDSSVTWNWDLEGAYQFGEEDFDGVTDQTVSAGFFSANEGLIFNDVEWKPAINGIFYWGSGDRDPTDGTNRTVNTLFPLGHAYWGQIDNFNGQNLLDFGLHFTVNPTDKFSFLTGVHWFRKAAKDDAIYNIVGAPFGGVVTTPSHLGTELDFVGTYKVNSNLSFQASYMQFWYGDAISKHPNALVSSRGDARQIYFISELTY